MYSLLLTKKALKDLEKIKKSNLKDQVSNLFSILKIDPFRIPPPFKKLSGHYDRIYSRRINIRHRLFYSVDVEEKTVTIVSAWGHD